MKPVIILLVAMALSASAISQTVDSIIWEKDIVYSNAGGVELKLDIARPAQGAGPFPVVVYFHGGGWQAGKRQDGYGQIRYLASQGYVGITVSYRFVPDYPWPAQVHDAKTAVRYVRTHAKELNIDPERIAAAGDSAGAYLALMLALTAPEDGLEGEGEWSTASSRVQAAVSFYSACDFTRGRSWHEPPENEEERQKRAALEELFQSYYRKSALQVIADMGGTDDPKSPRWKQLSPINYVSSNDSPILIIQGDADPIVSPEQAHWLDEALTQARVPHDLLMIEGGGHGFTREQYAVASAKMLSFLNQHMPAKRLGLWGDTSIPITEGLIYGRGVDYELKLDLAKPTAGAGPFPAVVWIHGGGWMSGNRVMGHGPLRLLATNGYVAVSISHRFTTEAPWPAQLHDVKAAVRYLRAQANELNIDPTRIAVMGESSGGHLALMAGLTDEDDALEGESGSPNFSSQVQAIVSYCSLTDFTKLRGDPPADIAARKDYEAKRSLLITLASTDDPQSAVWAQLSPVSYVDKNDPPVLIFQGELDDVVPPSQAGFIEERLQEAGVPHRVIRSANTGHVWKGEDRAMTNRVLLEFLAQALGTPLAK